MKHECPPSNDTLTTLAALEVLRGCPRGELARLARDADLVRVPAGVVIDHIGTSARQFVGIVDGLVRGAAPDGSTVELGPGDQFGAVELLGEHRHTKTYTSVTDATVVVVFGPTFRTASLTGAPTAA